MCWGNIVRGQAAVNGLWSVGLRSTKPDVDLELWGHRRRQKLRRSVGKLASRINDYKGNLPYLLTLKILLDEDEVISTFEQSAD